MITFGTDIEAMKMFPLYKELRKHKKDFGIVLVVTGEWNDLSESVLNQYGINPDIDPNIIQDNSLSIDIILREKYDELFKIVKPDILLVYGSTPTALVASFEAFYHNIEIGHIESEIVDESTDYFMENINRQLISWLSSFHFFST